MSKSRLRNTGLEFPWDFTDHNGRRPTSQPGTKGGREGKGGKGGRVSMHSTEPTLHTHTHTHGNPLHLPLSHLCPKVALAQTTWRI